MAWSVQNKTELAKGRERKSRIVLAGRLDKIRDRRALRRGECKKVSREKYCTSQLSRFGRKSTGSARAARGARGRAKDAGGIGGEFRVGPVDPRRGNGWQAEALVAERPREEKGK